jgi:hypothetical protein
MLFSSLKAIGQTLTGFAISNDDAKFELLLVAGRVGI